MDNVSSTTRSTPMATVAERWGLQFGVQSGKTSGAANTHSDERGTSCFNRRGSASLISQATEAGDRRASQSRL